MLFGRNSKLHKRLILSVSYVFSCFASFGQGGFNLRWPVELNTGFESVYALPDSTFLVTGWTRDSLTGAHVNFSLNLIGKQGQLLQEKSYESATSIYAADYDSESEVENWFVQPKQVYTDNNLSFRLIWFNQHIDTLFSKIIFSPHIDSSWADSNFMLPQAIAISKDSATFFSFGINHDAPSWNDICIKKLSSTGEELWTYIYATDGTDACYALLPQEDGGVIAGIAEGVHDDNPFQYTRFAKLDSFGNEDWVIDSRNMFASTFRAESMLQDGDFVICCGAYNVANPQLYGIGTIIKFDFDGSLLWKTDYGDFTDYDYLWHSLDNVVQTCDSNYLAGGSWNTYTPTPDIDEDDENHGDAYIVKLNRHNGEIIWERNYYFLDVPNDHQILVDMKATLDGGVIFCGEQRDATPMALVDYDIEYPRQQGWLVKLDECGCLIPGCDSLCSNVGCNAHGLTDSAFFPTFNSHFIIGPNPASHFINIYFGSLPSTLSNRDGARFQLHDAQGKLVYEFVPTEANTTYMLSTELFESGLYILNFRDNDGILQQQKIIVEKIKNITI